MAGTPQQGGGGFDPSALASDQSFAKMSVPQQMDYLRYASPEYKAMKPEDQLGYLNHVTGKQAPTTADNSVENASAKEGGWKEFGKGMAKAPLQAVDSTTNLLQKIPGAEKLIPQEGAAALHQIATPQNESQQIGSTAANRLATWVPLGAGAAEAGAAGKLVPWAKQLATSAVGGFAGAEGGKMAGQHFGGAAGGEIGEAIGGLAGGLAGGGAFGEKYRKIGNPADLPGIGKYLPDLLEGAEAKPVVSKAPFKLENPSVEPTPAVQNEIPFPKKPPAVSSEPFALENPKVEPTPAVQHELPRHGEIPMGTKTPFQLTPQNIEPTPAQQIPLEIPPAAKPQSTSQMVGKLGELVDQSTGRVPLDPSKPLNDQIPRNYAGSKTFRHPALAENPDITQPLDKAPEALKTIVPEQVGNQMGAPPLKPSVPLKEQLAPRPGEEPEQSEQARLEEKYPDRAERQMVKINGERAYNATKDDPDTLKALTKLGNTDIRQAMINSGEDMGQKNISDRKASGDLNRRHYIEQLMDKGYSPKEIVQLALKPIQ